MAELKDFLTYEGGATLEDFAPEVPTNLINTEVSNKTFAAKAALISDGSDVEGTYRKVNAELMEGPSSATSEQILSGVRQRQAEAAKKALGSIVTDPGISLETKQLALEATKSQINRAMSLNKTLAEEYAISPSEGETEEASNQRINVAGVLESIIDSKTKMQEMRNSFIASRDQGTVDAVIDFAESLIPFTTGGQLANYINEVNKAKGSDASKAKAFFLPGEAINDMKEALNKLPPEERPEAARKMLSILNAHPGNVLSDSNRFLEAGVVQAVAGGDYTMFDRFVDNITGLLDASIIGAPITKLAGKFGRGTKSAVEAVPEAVGSSMAGFDAGKVADKVTSGKSLQGAAKPYLMDMTEPMLNGERSLYNMPDTGLDDFMLRMATKDSVRSTVAPASAAQIMKDFNPSKARTLHTLVVGDMTEEAAQAAYGTSRAEAIASDNLPEIGNNGLIIRNKVYEPDAELKDIESPHSDIIDYTYEVGMIYYDRAAKEKARSHIVTDFENAIGAVARKEMFEVEAVPDGVVIRGVYGPKEGGFSSAKEAVDSLEYALKDYGITSKDFKVVVKNAEGNYVPHTGKIVGDDFLVSIDFKHTFNPADVVQHMEKAKVKNNWFDRLIPSWFGLPSSLGQGSLQSHILDAFSMLDTYITKGASVAIDRSVGLERALVKQGKEFAQGFSKLSKERRALIENTIKRANEEGLEITVTMAKAAGHTDEEFKLLRKWKESWDALWWLENRDLAKTLRNRNYKVFEHKGSGSTVIGKDVKNRGDLPNEVYVYDFETDIIRRVETKELDELYEKGGNITELRTHIKDSQGNDSTKYVINKNTPGDTFTRAIGENETVLNYRKGYYQVHYNEPFFIVKKVKDARNRVIGEEVVATAKSSKEAENLAARLMRQEAGSEYYHRQDLKKMSIDTDAYWDSATAIGRTAQKVRGKRLAGSTGTLAGNVLDPMESLTRSIRSTAARTSMRDYLDAVKARFMDQYGHLVPTVDGYKKEWPSSKEMIGPPGVHNKEIADAQTTYEYINTLENGYVNAMDESYKAMMNMIAEVVSKVAPGKVGMATEYMIRKVAEGMTPAQVAKSVAFKAYLATNPLRQFLVQGHQAIRLSFLFPTYMAKDFLKDWHLLLYSLRDIPIPDSVLKARGLTQKDVDLMTQQLKRSGLLAAVDANNLVRSDLVSLADTTVLQKAGSLLNAPIRTMQRWGFDKGEQFNMVSAWLAYRNKAIKEGKKLDAETMDEVAAMARNITYNMNRAGDMPYNRNALNLAFQFLQVPHKAVTQVLFNRALSRSDKVKLAIGDTVMWGAPIGGIPWIGEALDEMEDGEAKDGLKYGLEMLVLNKAISQAVGEDTKIDFTGLAPYNIASVIETVIELGTTDMGSIIAQSPSGQLFFGGNPRVTNAFKTAISFFHLRDEEDPAEFKTLVHDFLSISSGYSNMFYAILEMEVGKKLSSLGTPTDVKATFGTSFAKALGFNPIVKNSQYKVLKQEYEDSKSLEDDVDNFFRENWRRINLEERDRSLFERQISVLNKAHLVFNESPRAMKLMEKHLMKEFNSGDNHVVNVLLKSLDYKSPEEMRSILMGTEFSDPKIKENALDIISMLEKKGEIE